MLGAFGIGTTALKRSMRAWLDMRAWLAKHAGVARQGRGLGHLLFMPLSSLRTAAQLDFERKRVTHDDALHTSGSASSKLSSPAFLTPFLPSVFFFFELTSLTNLMTGFSSRTAVRSSQFHATRHSRGLQGGGSAGVWPAGRRAQGMRDIGHLALGVICHVLFLCGPLVARGALIALLLPLLRPPTTHPLECRLSMPIHAAIHTQQAAIRPATRSALACASALALPPASSPRLPFFKDLCAMSSGITMLPDGRAQYARACLLVAAGFLCVAHPLEQTRNSGLLSPLGRWQRRHSDASTPAGC